MPARVVLGLHRAAAMRSTAPIVVAAIASCTRVVTLREPVPFVVTADLDLAVEVPVDAAVPLAPDAAPAVATYVAVPDTVYPIDVRCDSKGECTLVHKEVTVTE